MTWFQNSWWETCLLFWFACTIIRILLVKYKFDWAKWCDCYWNGYCVVKLQLHIFRPVKSSFKTFLVIETLWFFFCSYKIVPSYTRVGALCSVEDVETYNDNYEFLINTARLSGMIDNFWFMNKSSELIVIMPGKLGDHGYSLQPDEEKRCVMSTDRKSALLKHFFNTRDGVST